MATNATGGIPTNETKGHLTAVYYDAAGNPLADPKRGKIVYDAKGNPGYYGENPNFWPNTGDLLKSLFVLFASFFAATPDAQDRLGETFAILSDQADNFPVYKAPSAQSSALDSAAAAKPFETAAAPTTTQVANTPAPAPTPTPGRS